MYTTVGGEAWAFSLLLIHNQKKGGCVMNKQIAISAKHLKKAFGKGESIQVIYSDLNIDIYKGDFTVIMGSSGAGKSTLMYSLSGMDKPDGGEIYFDGMDITKLNNDKLAVSAERVWICVPTDLFD